MTDMAGTTFSLQVFLGAIAIALIAGAIGEASCTAHLKSKKADDLHTQAAVVEGQTNAEAHTAQQATQAAQAAAKPTADADARVQQLEQLVAKLRASANKPGAIPNQHAVPVVGDQGGTGSGTSPANSTSLPGGIQSAGLDSAKDALIDALKVNVAAVKDERDKWKDSSLKFEKAYNDRTLQCTLQKGAYEAQIAAIKADNRIAMFEHLSIGTGGGAVIGIVVARKYFPK
jgi:hypothetical protein